MRSRALAACLVGVGGLVSLQLLGCAAWSRLPQEDRVFIIKVIAETGVGRSVGIESAGNTAGNTAQSQDAQFTVEMSPDQLIGFLAAGAKTQEDLKAIQGLARVLDSPESVSLESPASRGVFQPPTRGGSFGLLKLTRESVGMPPGFASGSWPVWGEIGYDLPVEASRMCVPSELSDAPRSGSVRVFVQADQGTLDYIPLLADPEHDGGMPQPVVTPPTGGFYYRPGILSTGQLRLRIVSRKTPCKVP